MSDLGAIALPLLFVAVFGFLTAPLTKLASRHMEHEADRFGLEITRSNRASARSFVKGQKETLAFRDRHFFSCYGAEITLHWRPHRLR